jgi:hypothetical protein
MEARNKAMIAEKDPAAKKKIAKEIQYMKFEKAAAAK